MAATDTQPCPTPVILLVWNRPDCAARVLEAVAAARPTRLFVVADGPRDGHPADAEACARTRALVDDLPWECDVHRNFADRNLGLRQRIASGITWAFEHVDRAIVIEDDCLADASFFPFATELLARYADDERVMQVNGSNLAVAATPPGASYFFSNHPHIWGWATWRRAWQHFDVDLATWPAFRDAGMVDWLPFPPAYRRHLTGQLDRVHDGRLNTWDYIWTYTVYRHHGLSIVPAANLVSNVGFGAGATHTKDDRDPLANLPCGTIHFPLVHPANVVPCRPWEDAVTVQFQRGLVERAARKAGRLLRGLRQPGGPPA